MPVISIIMPVYNESNHELYDSIQSMLNQTYSNFEYIIIDDNPKSVRIKQFLFRESKKDKRIRLIFNKRNLKLTKSENKGIKYAKGKYISRMDADDVAYKDRLIKQLNFLIKNNLDIVCCNCSVINNNNNIMQTHSFSTITQTNQESIKHIMSYCNVANGPTLFFKKRVFNVIGGYRNSYTDDYDFAARALINGFRLGYQSEDLIKKRHRTNSISNENILEQFTSVLKISNFLKKTRFKSVLPASVLYLTLNCISKRDKILFCDFLKNKQLFKKNKSLINLVKAVLCIMSSKIIFKRFVWCHLIGNKQNHFIK